MLKMMKSLFPSKIKEIMHVIPCFYSLSDDQEFVFEKVGKTIFAFGGSGRGFKHMAYHGKRVYHLIMDNFKEANKYKLEKKEEEEMILLDDYKPKL